MWIYCCIAWRITRTDLLGFQYPARTIRSNFYSSALACIIPVLFVLSKPMILPVLVTYPSRASINQGGMSISTGMLASTPEYLYY
jgi:hypothetical protein